MLFSALHAETVIGTHFLHAQGHDTEHCLVPCKLVLREMFQEPDSRLPMMINCDSDCSERIPGPHDTVIILEVSGRILLHVSCHVDNPQSLYSTRAFESCPRELDVIIGNECYSSQCQ